MTEQLVKQTLDKFKQRKAERTNLNQLWEEIAEVLAPERCGFMNTSSYKNRNDARIYDTQPIIAKRGLVNAISGMLRPKSTSGGKWFDIVPAYREELLDDVEVKGWIDNAENTLWQQMYNPTAGFIEATGEVDDDLVTFGTGLGYVGLRPDMSGLMYKAFHLNKVYLDVDGLNEVVGVFVAEQYSPRQAAMLFGEENLGAKTKERLRQTNKKARDDKSEYIWCVSQRFEFDPMSRSNTDMAYSSIVIDVDSEHVIEESGYEEMPFFIPRWDTRSNEAFGRGVGTLALPSVLTLNQMGKTMLRALHRAVDPPWLLPSDSMVNAPQLRPGGVSYYDAKAIRNLGLSKPFQQMDSAAQIPWGLNAQQAERESIMQLFFKNVLSLPIGGPTMTATEVLERRESFVREVGSLLGGLEKSYTSVLTERSFNILLRKGAFGPLEEIPDVLQGEDITFRFASPVEKAKRQIEEAGVSMAMDKVLQIGQIKPEIMDRFNFDEYAKFIAKSNDFPHELIKPDAMVEQEAQMKAMQMQQEKKMQTMQQMAPMIGQLTAGGGGAPRGAPPEDEAESDEQVAQLAQAVGGALGG